MVWENLSLSISWELSEGVPDVMGFLFVPVMVNNRLYASAAPSIRAGGPGSREICGCERGRWKCGWIVALRHWRLKAAEFLLFVVETLSGA